MYKVAELAELIRQEKAGDVLGITEKQISEIQDAWGVPRLPSAYVEFLTRMGARAGRLLRGTDAFYPVVLQMREWADEFFDENSDFLPLRGGEIVFAMHQGYLAYWMSDISAADPEVVLWSEAVSTPLRVWPTFTAFLNSHYADEPGVK
ncbi:SMI1/KNR4 family protein [Micromonospora sp. CA-240977]|uniref:SMI1/KNR4 family protein n=1 Tax=Micromonospora sp. CA-240977 TaxID=3239957 RepID=UPI003D91EEB8